MTWSKLKGAAAAPPLFASTRTQDKSCQHEAEKMPERDPGEPSSEPAEPLVLSLINDSNASVSPPSASHSDRSQTNPTQGYTYALAYTIRACGDLQAHTDKHVHAMTLPSSISQIECPWGSAMTLANR